MNKISWHRTSVGEEEIAKIREVMLKECVSMGRITEEFEALAAKRLEVRYCVATPSGSVALLMSLMALGIGRGDEVIVPNRGWIAAAHAVLLIGAKLVLCDVDKDRSILDVADAARRITARTKAIIPLHLNGRSVDMDRLLALGREKKIFIIEDACQSIFSRRGDVCIGTRGDLGCYSLGMAKLVATGQGGLVVTNDEMLYRKLRSLRGHGVRDNFTEAWYQFGFNFKFTDIQAAVGLVQLDRAPGRIGHLKEIYRRYEKSFAGMRCVRMIPVDIAEGEVPLYTEVLAERRDALIAYLNERGIQARPSTPDLDPTPYLGSPGDFPHSRVFGDNGVYLPGGPEQPLANVDRVVEVLREFDGS